MKDGFNILKMNYMFPHINILKKEKKKNMIISTDGKKHFTKFNSYLK